MVFSLEIIKMNKLTNLAGIVGLSLASLVSGCKPQERPIEIFGKADFDRDGIEDVVGYILTESAITNSGPFDLVIISGKHIIRKNDIPYVQRGNFKIIQSHAKYGEDIKIKDLNLEDVNGDGLPDISYDVNFGNRRHKVLYNQGDGTLKGQM